MVALTNYGDMLLFKKSVMLQRLTVELSPRDISDAFNNDPTLDKKRVLLANVEEYRKSFFPCVISATIAGVVVGFQGINIVAIFDLLKEGKMLFKRTYKFNVPNFHRMVYMHVGPEDGYISMAVQHQQK